METATTKENSGYVVPTTKIKSVQQLNQFLESDLCKNYIQFLEDLNESVNGKDMQTEVQVRPVC